MAMAVTRVVTMVGTMTRVTMVTAMITTLQLAAGEEVMMAAEVGLKIERKLFLR